VRNQTFFKFDPIGIMIKSAYLLNSFTEADIPPSPCSSSGASIVARSKTIACDESRESRAYYELVGDPETTVGTFVI
jgi:hypothetical protein